MAITRVSTASDGTQGTSVSQTAATGSQVSADGRYVVFQSLATNLVAGDTNAQQDVFVKDTLTGTVTLVSTSSAGVQGNSTSNTASISADGTRVAFQSSASNLVAGDTNGQQDIFVKDLTTGTTTRVSTDSTGAQTTSGTSTTPSISADGTRVAFQSGATNLVAGDTNGLTDVFVKNLTTGTTTRVSTDSAGAQVNGTSNNASISADGTRIAFQSIANNLVVGDTNSLTDVFVKDLTTGNTTLVSTDSTGAQASSISSNASISADGTRVAFQSTATNLVAGDTNGATDVFVKDLGTGTTTRVSTDSTGAQATGGGGSTGASISADGTRVAFQSTATNLVAGDTNNTTDAFVKDLSTGTTTRVSTDSTGAQVGSSSNTPSISGDGTRVAFQSNATNIVTGDTNGFTDVFLADVACYVTGTRIRTEHGEVAVEDLRVGDRVLTGAGQHRPIRWIGSRALAPRRHPRPGQAQPVR
ncbi:Hint domain-containing protein, partial [Methylobacterium goesingense]